MPQEPPLWIPTDSTDATMTEMATTIISIVPFAGPFIQTLFKAPADARFKRDLYHILRYLMDQLQELKVQHALPASQKEVLQLLTREQRLQTAVREVVHRDICLLAWQVGVELATLNQTGTPDDDGSESPEGLSTQFGVDIDELEDALADLVEKGCVDGSVLFPELALRPTSRLFWRFDAAAIGSDPAEDGAQLAPLLLAEQKLVVGNLENVHNRSGLSLRRFNPATTFLVEHGLASGIATMGTWPYMYAGISPNRETRVLAEKVRSIG